MGSPRKKQADWNLFQPFSSAPRADPAPSGDSLNLFEPPPGYQPPGRQDQARAPKKPSKPPESELNLFEPPPGAPAPKQAPEPQRAPESELNLFEPPPPAPERARAPEEAQPSRAPTPPPRSAPSAPGRQVGLGEQTGQMRRTQEFRQFVREKYNGGDVRIRHPDPEKRQRRPTIKFWTAMKYDTFKTKVKREFEAWRQEQEAQRPRAQVGDRITDLDQVRLGDFVQSGGVYGTKFKVMRRTPRQVHLQRVSPHGHPTGPTKKFNLARVRQKRLRRIDEIKRPDVQFEQAQAHIDSRAGHPPRDVKNKADYRAWLKRKLTEGPRAPFAGLRDDETRHQEQLKRHIDKILEDRGIAEDWKWEPPSRAQIGERVSSPLQLKAGDFIQSYGTSYKVINVDEDGDDIRVVPVDQYGRPTAGGRTFGRGYLRDYTSTRIEAVQRPDVSYDRFKAFAKSLGHPPREVNSRTKYKEWLENKAKLNDASPYKGLGSDEVEHTNALEKQIKKVLEERGVGPDWTWEPPPPITFPATSEWKARQKELIKIAEQGQKVGPDRELGRDTANAPVKRLMRLDGDDHPFIFKAKYKEPGQDGSSYGEQISNKTGVPSGEMHNREEAAYEIDRLLGEDTIVPVTRSSGEGEDGLGAYQAWIEGMQTAANAGHLLDRISNEDLLRHQDVGRIMVLDVLLGHQDRHPGNLGFSWVDPYKPHTAENLRLHAIDNGYALATTEPWQEDYSWDIREPWPATGDRRNDLVENYFKAVPDEMRQRLQNLSTKDVAKALIKSGLKDKELIMAAAVRLALLKHNPEALAKMISDSGGDSYMGQRQFQYQSHHKPEELLAEMDLPASTYANIQRDVRAALRDVS